MDIITINKSLTENILSLRVARKVIDECAQNKAHSVGEYEKVLAITLIRLKNGETMELGGEEIINPPATISRDIAKGICYQEKINMELAESAYKNATIGLETVKTTIMALQSMLKFVDET